MFNIESKEEYLRDYLYKDLSIILVEDLASFREDGEKVSSAIEVKVTDNISEELIYGLSFVWVHDAVLLIGSCFGGGYEFTHWITGNDDDFTEILKNNFVDMGLELIKITS